MSHRLTASGQLERITIIVIVNSLVKLKVFLPERLFTKISSITKIVEKTTVNLWSGYIEEFQRKYTESISFIYRSFVQSVLNCNSERLRFMQNIVYDNRKD